VAGTEPYYDRVTEHGYIHLACHDCAAELRLLDSQAGRDRADAILRVHKTSGCCDERQATLQAKGAI
jgi:hypothetical protein